MPSETSNHSHPDAGVSRNGAPHPSAESTKTTAEPVGYIVPRAPRGQAPDLDLVFQDLTQLNLPIAREQIAAASDAYQRVRDAIYADGYEPATGVPPVRGIPGLTNYCLNAVVMGVIALRDPMFREALRVSRAYYATDEDFEADDPEAGFEDDQPQTDPKDF